MPFASGSENPQRWMTITSGTMVRGLKKFDQMFVLSMAAFNLVRMRSLGQIRQQLR